VKPKETGKADAQVQVNKFHSFKTNPNEKKVSFGVVFYFYGKPIVRYIIMILRITYSSRLWNLQSTTGSAESARTDCEITNPDLVGKTIDDGQNVNYNCTANIIKSPEGANFTLNTDIPLTMVSENGTVETLGFEEINFNGDADKASTSIQESIEEVKSQYIIDKSYAFFEGYVLKVIGTYKSESMRLRNLAINDGKDIPMDLKDKDGNTKSYTCIINGVNEGFSSELSCDTSGDIMTTTPAQLDCSSGLSNGDLLTIKMESANDTEISPTSSGSRIFSKSSGGLSGGAIAGIVIACVVVLAATSIAAILLRKPSPAMDNTTVVGLKPENM